MWIFNYLLILSEISRTVPSFLFRFARENHPSFINEFEIYIHIKDIFNPFWFKYTDLFTFLITNL